MSSSEPLLTMRVVTPGGIAGTVQCDSITLNMVDDVSGNGGGSMGIHCGFQDAVIALATGPVVAKLNGEQMLKAEIKTGFATVKDNVVSIISDSLQNVEVN